MIQMRPINVMLILALLLSGLSSGMPFGGLSISVPITTAQAGTEPSGPADANVAPTPDFQVGDYLVFGAYRGQPILWRIINVEGNGDPLLVSDRILTFKSFDAAGTFYNGYYDQNERAMHGSSYYPSATLRIWLNSKSSNSDSDFIQWPNNRPTVANIKHGKNGYDNEKGFLANGNFTASERYMIKPYRSSFRTSNINGGNVEDATDRVFLMSDSLINQYIVGNAAILGVGYDYAKPTSDAVNASLYKNPDLSENKSWKYWVNGSMLYYPSYVSVRGDNSNFGTEYAYDDSVGVRPAIVLNKSMLHMGLGGDGSGQQPYRVLRDETTPPTVPGDLAADTVRALDAQLKWNPSIDKYGVEQYKIYRDGALVGTVSHEPDASRIAYNATGLTQLTTYTFTVRAVDESGNESQLSEPITLTTKSINEVLRIGDYVRFGTYNEKPILWRIIHIDENGHAVLFADRILTLKAFDSAGYYAHNDPSFDISQYIPPSNFYPKATLRTWLNSSQSNAGDDRIEWPYHVPKSDYMFFGGNGYDKEKGFLADGNFTETERRLLKSVTHNVVLSEPNSGEKDGGTQPISNTTNMYELAKDYDTLYYKQVSDRVFLLSIQQLQDYVLNQSGVLGMMYHRAKPTPEAVTQSEVKYVFFSEVKSENNWDYWLSTPDATSDINVRTVSIFPNYIGNHTAFWESNGVRPALKLNVTNAVFLNGGNGSVDNPFAVSREQLRVDSEAPTVPSDLRVVMVNHSQIKLQWTAATDNDAVTKYGIYRDGQLIDRVYTSANTFKGAASPADTVYTAVGLAPDTSYSFAVRAEDDGWNVSALTEAVTVTTAEGVAPTKPSDLQAENVTSTGITLNWKSSTDNVGVTAYDVYQDETLIASLPGEVRTFAVSGLEPNKAYLFRIVAKDAADNQSEPSDVLQVTTLELPDMEAPNAPSGLVASQIGVNSLMLSWQPATDNKGVVAYEVYKDSQLLAELSGQALKTNFQVTDLPSTTMCSFFVKARDNTGNVSAASDLLQVRTLDGVAPTVPRELVVTGLSSSGFAVGWAASTDDTAVAGYDVYLDDKLLGTVSDTKYTVAGLPEYKKSVIVVRARDAAGNVSAASSDLTVTTLDKTAPVIPTGLNVTRRSTSGFRIDWKPSTDRGSGVYGYEVYLDGELEAIVMRPRFVFDDLDEHTSYTVTVKAKDKVGNTSETSSPLTVKTLDGTPPTPPANVTLSTITATTLTLNWTPSADEAGVSGYEVYRGATLLNVVPASATKLSVTGLSPGTTYTFSIRARDATGNVSQSSNLLTATTKSVMEISGKTISVNGKPILLGAGVESVTINGSLMVPFRPIFEALELKVSYNSITKIIEGSRTGYHLKLQLNSRTAVVNGNTNKLMPVAPTTVKGVTMVPLRFIGEELGVVVTFRSK